MLIWDPGTIVAASRKGWSFHNSSKQFEVGRKAIVLKEIVRQNWSIF